MMDVSNALGKMPERRDQVSRDQLLRRVRAEFEEMPCLRLTRRQAQRLFGLRADICDRILAALVADRSLCRESDDRYRVLTAGAPRPSVALERQAFQ